MNEAVLRICIFPALPTAKSIRKVSTSNAWAKPSCLSLSLLLTPQSKPKSYLGFCKVLQSGLPALALAHPSYCTPFHLFFSWQAKWPFKQQMNWNHFTAENFQWPLAAIKIMSNLLWSIKFSVFWPLPLYPYLLLTLIHSVSEILAFYLCLVLPDWIHPQNSACSRPSIQNTPPPQGLCHYLLLIS